MNVGVESICPSHAARNIGVFFDEWLAKCVNLPLFNIAVSRKLKNILVRHYQILAHAFVTSNLDNCNSFLHGLPKGLIQELQLVKNATARLVS